ncbi:Rubrerythrin [Planktothrix sp. PCC 11201]|uniref:rubrerythrin family protein n=1 Tax=Planktothrix sp. PCC 11201 TaxID=1729650 RepID=UPI00091DD184|nr:rubrerythrin family protein [Planktothrix sp. PCC 11201]SKB11622.1 Rubrerythrin [Planktothrix sp. PCC 11201]
MIRVFKSHSLSKKTAVLASLAVLGTASLFGCNQSQPPVAKVEAPPTQPPAQPVAQAESPTLKNMQAAYNGESNAHVMYLGFAEKAEQEGYKEVASLFRAAAKAEQIHRDNHAQVIQTMGATPKNTITTPEAKSTAENLQQAIKGESYERDTMYPGFITQAKTENNEAALKSLNYALAAETQHAKLYTEASENLTAWREATPFYVCKVSGETVVNEGDTASCPSVTSGQAYESVI